MSTDPFVRQIRALVDEAPPVAVDRSMVLRSGRRRRLARASGVSVLTVVASIGLFTGVSALQAPDVTPAISSPAPSTPSPEPTDVLEPTAEVDAEAGTITLPLDDWVWSADDWTTVQTAQALKNSRCMEDAGFGEYQPFAGTVRAGPDPSYGVWVRAEVEEQGYARMDPVETPEAGLPHTAASRAASDACSREAFQEWGWPELERVWASAPRSWGPPTADPQYPVILEEWAACLERNGLARPDLDHGGSHVPGGVLGADLHEQVRIGLIDVGCKEEVDFVQRMADIEAAQQVEYFARAQEHLELRRAAETRVLEHAQALLDEEGVVIGED